MVKFQTRSANENLFDSERTNQIRMSRCQGPNGSNRGARKLLVIDERSLSVPVRLEFGSRWRLEREITEEGRENDVCACVQ